MKIPDEMWHCPECGAGYDNGTGLTGPDYTTYEEYVAVYGTDDGDGPENYGYCYYNKNSPASSAKEETGLCF